MNGETDLAVLLATLTPQLQPQTYVFCTVPEGTRLALGQLNPLATFQEPEGLTLVLTEAEAQIANLAYTAVFRCITLKVHSSLEAVGLTAAVATALTEAQITANVIAAYYHDHVFVQAQRAEEALAVLTSLSLSAR